MNVLAPMRGWDEVIARIKAIFTPDRLCGAAWGIVAKTGLIIFKNAMPIVKLIPTNLPQPTISIYKFGKNGTERVASWQERSDNCWISETGLDSLEGLVDEVERICRNIFTEDDFAVAEG